MQGLWSTDEASESGLVCVAFRTRAQDSLGVCAQRGIKKKTMCLEFFENTQQLLGDRFSGASGHCKAKGLPHASALLPFRVVLLSLQRPLPSFTFGAPSAHCDPHMQALAICAAFPDAASAAPSVQPSLMQQALRPLCSLP